jgi:hypothetical protein
MTAEEILEYIEEKNRQIERLNLQYGDKRPAWIDDQLQMLRFYRADAQKALDKITPVATIVRLVDDAKDVFSELPTMGLADFDNYSRGIAILDEIKRIAQNMEEAK